MKEDKAMNEREEIDIEELVRVLPPVALCGASPAPVEKLTRKAYDLTYEIFTAEHRIRDILQDIKLMSRTINSKHYDSKFYFKIRKLIEKPKTLVDSIQFELDLDDALANDSEEIINKYRLAASRFGVSLIEQKLKPLGYGFSGDYIDIILNHISKDEFYTRLNPYIIQEDVENAIKELPEYNLPKKVNLIASIGYDPKLSADNRYDSLQELQSQDGRTASQKLKDKTFKKIDSKIRDTLKSIAEQDPDSRVVELAQEMVRNYELAETFDLGKKLQSGKY